MSPVKNGGITSADVYPLEAEHFGQWLHQIYYRKGLSGLSAGGLESATFALAGHAKFDGEQHPVHMRSAEQNGRYYVDLCDAQRSVIEIDAEGWHYVDRSPVMFLRSPESRALPAPEAGGKFTDILPFLNLPKGNALLLQTWMIECLRSDTQKVGMVPFGLKGAAKSTMQKYLRDLIDPNAVNVRASPKNREDIVLSRQHSLLLSYENMSKLDQDKQNALCTIFDRRRVRNENPQDEFGRNAAGDQASGDLERHQKGRDELGPAGALYFIRAA